MNKLKINYQLKIGILGGGQLARLLSIQGHHLGLNIFILSKDKNDPAAQVNKNWLEGDPNNLKDLLKFAKNVDILTYESEFLKVELLDKIQKKFKHLSIYPQHNTMEMLQDRLTQKLWIKSTKVPTSQFVKVDCLDDLKNCFNILGHHIVLKKRRFGYDGYGTYILNKKSLQPNNFKKLKIDFDNNNYIAEKFVKFKRELAFTIARSKDGSIAHFPLVESHQVDHRCKWVMGPTQHPQFNSVKKKISKALSLINYVGCLSVELFDSNNQLIVNEIAPRVHNSAHYSLDALSLDQFSAHLLSLIGVSLKNPILLSPAFAMANILGPKNNLKLNLENRLYGKLYWYGKEQANPGRKMGHITVLDKNKNVALKKALLSDHILLK